MKLKLTLTAGLILVCSGLTLHAENRSWTDQEPYCGRTARSSFRSCVNDASASFWTAWGNCVNQSTIGERRGCRDDAKLARVEERDLCVDILDAQMDLCDALGGARYIADFDPDNFVIPDEITVPNPYWSLTPGDTRVLSDGGSEVNVIYRTPETVFVDGVPCRTVVDIAMEAEVDPDSGEVEYEVVEATDDWYAQHVNGDVWYCGEAVRNFEDGILVDLDGSFQAGVDGAQAGILIPANPVVGDIYRQEVALREAEDIAEVLSLAASPAQEVSGFECDGACLRTREFTPLEPEGEENKYYIAGLGFVLATKFEDGVLQPEREELICTGSSLDVLSDPACGVADPDKLREVLCLVDPEVFCGD